MRSTVGKLPPLSAQCRESHFMHGCLCICNQKRGHTGDHIDQRPDAVEWVWPNEKETHHMLEWTYNQTETATAATPEYIAIVSRTTHMTRNGDPIAYSEWHGSLIRDTDLATVGDTIGTTVVATATDKDRDSCIRALEAYVLAVELARERNAQPQDGPSVDALTRERDPFPWDGD